MSPKIAFQLAAGLSAERHHDVVTIKRAGIPVLHLVFPDESIKIAAGGDVPGLGGWDSSRFGSKVVAERLSWHGKVDESGVRIHLLPHYENKESVVDQIDSANAPSVARQ